MSCHRFGRTDGRRAALAKDAADRLDLAHVADGGRGAMCVDVTHGAIIGQGLQRKPHGPLAAFTRRGHHVVAVRGGRIAGDFGVNFGAARAGMFQLFQHNDAAATRYHEPVAIRVKGAAGCGGCVVVFGRHRAHRVKEAGQRPVQFFGPAGEHHVLFAQHDLFRCIADAVQRSRTGGCNRIVDALDLEACREVGRDRGRHAFGHCKGADPLGRPGFEHCLMRGQHGGGRRPA
mmetsp:Transcript_29107/g.56040  ORF Transcript_29107/g.56040 Transcript_29107/m.56040 type:complete len:232 (-) Transcript_29107:1960-2655(-)